MTWNQLKEIIDDCLRDENYSGHVKVSRIDIKTENVIDSSDLVVPLEEGVGIEIADR